MDKYAIMQLIDDLAVMQLTANDLQNEVVKATITSKLRDIQADLEQYASKLMDK